MTQPIYWPNSRIEKSMNNVFTEHLRERRSIFRGDPAFRSNAAPVVTDPAKHRYGSEYSRAGSAKG